MPQAIIIAGANGAGKTSFARELLSLYHHEAVFLNADEIQREDERFRSPVAAGREMIRRIDQCVREHQSFSVETTLSSMFYAKRIADWRQAGFSISMHFIEIASADLAVMRVRERVRNGGHSIPEDDIRRRYARGLRLFNSRFRLLPDVFYHYISDENGLRVINENS